MEHRVTACVFVQVSYLWSPHTTSTWQTDVHSAEAVTHFTSKIENTVYSPNRWNKCASWSANKTTKQIIYRTMFQLIPISTNCFLNPMSKVFITACLDEFPLWGAQTWINLNSRSHLWKPWPSYARWLLWWLFKVTKTAVSNTN